MLLATLQIFLLKKSYSANLKKATQQKKNVCMHARYSKHIDKLIDNRKNKHSKYILCIFANNAGVAVDKPVLSV